VTTPEQPRGESVDSSAGSDNRSIRPVARRMGIEPAQDRSENLLEWLYQLRDYQREHQRNGAWLIKGRDLPWEQNRQGKMKWFLHPALDNTSIRSMLFLMQEIPPEGKSGVQKTPGGQVLYIISGRGYTLLDGERYDWEAEDVVNIPIRANGVHVQHVNIDRREPVVFVQAEINLMDMLGVDRGSELEQVEVAPDFERIQE
jgi:gentisate 1,2-dioxygenase